MWSAAPTISSPAPPTCSTFAFGAPKVREVDASVGGIRVLEMDTNRMPEARKIMPYGYATEVGPGPIFVGVEKPMKVYTFDNIIFTNAKASDDFVYKILDTLEKEQGGSRRGAAGAEGIDACVRI